MKRILAAVMTVAILAALAVPVFAVKSAEVYDGKYTTKIIVIYGEGDADLVKNTDETITLVGKPDDGQTFQQWVIFGKYKIISGTRTDDSMTIELYSDVTIEAYFSGEGSRKPDNGGNSPITGASAALYVIVAVMALGAATVAVRKKIAE